MTTISAMPAVASPMISSMAAAPFRP
jgi:hypothetical protein